MLPDLQRPIVKVSPAITRHTSLLPPALGFHRFLKPAFAQLKVLVEAQEREA